MARQKPADKVESLRRQQAGITAKLKEAEAREKGAEKALTERRRQVAGAVALGMIRQEPDGVFAVAFRAGLDGIVRKAGDRALFDLPPLDDRKKAG